MKTDAAIGQLEESLKQDREKNPVQEQQIEVLITKDTYPLLFKEFRALAEEAVELFPNDVGNDVICKRAETDFEKALSDTGVAFKIKFKDGFSCKVLLV